MKKQIRPAVKAYLLRGAFYLVLLLGVSAIPFVLAQRNVTNRETAKPTSSLPAVPQLTSGRLGAHIMLAPPLSRAPQTALYDQYNNAGEDVTVSATFTDFPTSNADLADDFVVPAGQTWNVQSIDADGVYFNGSGPAIDWNVFFYADNAGFPGAQVYSTTHQPLQQNGSTFTVNLSTPAVLSAGTYWVEIQANMTYGTQGEWGWSNRTVTSYNAAAWQNPGGGLGVCPSWSRRGATCGTDPSEPDQMYRLNGTTNRAQLGNISTRAFVQTGDNVMIGGFIVQGTTPKRVIIRAIGPELGAPPYNVPGALADPTLELHDGSGALIASNDNWQTTIIGGIITNNQVSDIQNSRHAPGDARESAIIADLPAGNYTAIVRGVNSTTGVALAEVYDLSSGTNSTLDNISTRAFVQTGNNVMIGGFIVQGTTPKSMIIGAIGPELGQYGVPNPLADPTLELHDGTGALIGTNDNWQTTIIGGIITHDQVQEIQDSGYAPGDGRESAIIADLPAGNYTAIVRGVNSTIGVALVEVYDLSPQSNLIHNTNSILGNISTRSFVQTGDNVMIGGFIVQGTQPKRVIIRAIGPELGQFGVPDPLQDPTLELHDGTGALIGRNDNWQTTIIGGIITHDQVQEIQNSGYAPGDQRESAIIADLPAGNYTAIVRGVNSTIGVALVEVYDLSPQSNLIHNTNSILGNLSTRSVVQTADNVMIGGFIVQGTQPKRVIIRAIGPELGQFGVPDPLQDPTLELHDGTGALIGRNDNWQTTIIGGIITHDQVQEIQDSGYAPGDGRESAIIAELPAGNYTAIVRGVNSTTGVALVEVYDLQ